MCGDHHLAGGHRGGLKRRADVVCVTWQMDAVVRVDAFLADFDDIAACDDVYREFFRGDLPARMTVQAGLGEIKVEIAVVAFLA